jgi:hypothetical protein
MIIHGEGSRPAQQKHLNKNARPVEGIEAQTKIENLSSIAHTVERGQVLPPNSASNR